MLSSVIRNYSSEKSPISHKYLNHGTLMCLRARNLFGLNRLQFKKPLIRNYSSTNNPHNTDNAQYNPVKIYENAYDMKNLILKENKNKVGIYKWTNKLNNKCYVGSSINLWRRFLNYFNLSYLSNKKNNLKISRALVKHGYSNFSIEILEYCSVSDLLEREQYYLDLLKPEYNTEKIAGSSLGLKRSEETKAKISKALKGVDQKVVYLVKRIAN